MAGAIGRKRFLYDPSGDAVNTARRATSRLGTSSASATTAPAAGDEQRLTPGTRLVPEQRPSSDRRGPRPPGGTMYDRAISPSTQAKRRLWRMFGPRLNMFLKHYVLPLRRGRAHAPYEARAFFESWHRSLPAEVSDAETISPGSRSLDARFHYNQVENGIMEGLERLDPEPSGPPAVLDVGSGSGHWVDFYLEVVGASSVTAVELSNVAAESLRGKYAGQPVTVVAADIADPDVGLGGPYEIVNAIGVMFHIVEDERWEAALATLARHLRPGGILVVSGQFGLATRDVQFHGTDRFERWEDRNRGDGAVLVNKRIRSLRRWRAAARRAGLRVERVSRTRGSRTFRTPENNLLFLRRPSGETTDREHAV